MKRTVRFPFPVYGFRDVNQKAGDPIEIPAGTVGEVRGTVGVQPTPYCVVLFRVKRRKVWVKISTQAVDEAVDAMQLLNFQKAATEAGFNGVIARRAWGDEQVILVRKFEVVGGSVSAVLFLAADEQMGNYDPSDEDLQADDWQVVARSFRRRR